MADMLSQKRVVASSCLYCKSYRSLLSHKASHAVAVEEIYSASTVDKAKPFYFFDDQDVTFVPKQKI